MPAQNSYMKASGVISQNATIFGDKTFEELIKVKWGR